MSSLNPELQIKRGDNVCFDSSFETGTMLLKVLSGASIPKSESSLTLKSLFCFGGN